MKDLRSPLAKVKGLGTSPEASHHYWVQRLSALGLVPLTLWFCFSVALLPEVTYSVITGWLASPFNATMMILVVLVSLQHAHLGLQVILEDYVAKHGPRVAAILVVKFISYFLMALGVYSIVKIALGGA